MTEKGSGCSQLQKVLVVGESDKVESGGGSCGRREGHFAKAGELWLFNQLGISLQTDMMAMLKVTEDTHEACWMETLFFPLLAEVESEKDKPRLFSLDSVSLLHTPPFSSPVLWQSPRELWSLILLMLNVWRAWHEQQFEMDAERHCTWWLTSQMEDVAFGKWRLSWSREHCGLSFAVLSWCWVMGR